eukprot:358176-Chlamydomonas_euryale.AAC.5
MQPMQPIPHATQPMQHSQFNAANAMQPMQRTPHATQPMQHSQIQCSQCNEANATHPACNAARPIAAQDNRVAGPSTCASWMGRHVPGMAHGRCRPICLQPQPLACSCSAANLFSTEATLRRSRSDAATKPLCRSLLQAPPQLFLPLPRLPPQLQLPPPRSPRAALGLWMAPRRACLLARLLDCSLACLLACLLSCLLGCLLPCLLVFLLAWLLACLLAWLVTVLGAVGGAGAGVFLRALGGAPCVPLTQTRRAQPAPARRLTESVVASRSRARAREGGAVRTSSPVPAPNLAPRWSGREEGVKGAVGGFGYASSAAAAVSTRPKVWGEGASGNAVR